MRALALLLCCALVLPACTSADSTGLGRDFVRGAGGAEVPLAEREPAPPVDAETLDGRRVRLTDLPGPVVVNFWASWCGPCATEAPDLQAVWEDYGDHGVSVVGVNVRDRVANARSFEHDFGITYPSWYDEASTIAASFGGIGPAALPSTIILDAEHRVAVRLFGSVTATRLSAYLDGLLAEAGREVPDPRVGAP
jgi:thiol-disulfide isomerase/thioredoxin